MTKDDRARALLASYLTARSLPQRAEAVLMKHVLTPTEQAALDAIEASMIDSNDVEVEAPTESTPLLDAVAHKIKMNYIGVSASDMKARRTAEDVLQIVMDHYMQEAEQLG